MSLEKQNDEAAIAIALERIYLSSIWKAASIEDQPEVALVNWAIKQTDQGEYFVGTTYDGNGRVSTQIMEFDQAKMIGRTMSGRVYHLNGPAGYSSNGEYVWAHYKVRNKLTEIEAPSSVSK